MRKMRKVAIGFWVVLTLVMMMSVNVLAGQEELTFVVFGMQGEEAISASPAYVLNEGGIYSVLADLGAVSDDVDMYVLLNATDGQEYPIVFENKGFGEINLAIFSLQGEIPPASQIAMPGIARKGQTVEMLYLDNEANPVSRNVKLTEAMETENGYLLLNVEAVDEVGEYVAPMLFLDDSGDMAAIGTSTGDIAAFHTDLATFNGGDSTSGSDSSETESNNPARTGPETQEPASDSEPWWKNQDLLIGGIIGGIGGIIGIAIKFSKKKKNSEVSGTPALHGIPDSPIADDSIPNIPEAPAPSVPRQPISPAPQPISPAPQPMPQPNYQTSGTTIIGTAGNMVNQVYTVTSSGLTFGRDASCFVRFPADTKGVSRIHCQVHLDGGGNLVLTDCNATYGTHIKRYGTTKPVRLEPNSSVRLQKGDKFYLGSNNISFQVQ